MTMATSMQVNIRLPQSLLFTGKIRKLTATAENGSFGIWPNHSDFVTALVPSVLVLTDIDNNELLFGMDEGLLVKAGHQVDIAVNRAVQSDDLGSLHELLSASFHRVDEQERSARTAISKLEMNMVRQISELKKP
ncbi:MAG TPA: ATPase [Pseudomonadaceae bacterium]|nr:ATPase [Pseudomonadaceae bacterium]